MMIIIFYLLYIINPLFFPLITTPFNLFYDIPIIYICFPKQLFLIHENFATNKNITILFLEIIFMVLAHYEKLLVTYYLIGLWLDLIIIYLNINIRNRLRILYLILAIFKFDYIYISGMLIYILIETI